MNRRHVYLTRYGRGDMGSIPHGVGGPPPPGTHSPKGKIMCIKVRLLDDTIAVFHLGHKALGQTLMDEVCRHLNLLERDYFGLVFVDSNGLQCWLEMEKPILRQIANTRADAKFYLILKFYIPNPVDLEEEYTRYLFTLQIRRDLSTGELMCSEGTAALLSAYIVQSDCGDFSEDDYPDARYLSHTRFIPNQTFSFQELVRNNHRRLVGMSPGESDLALLEVARRCEFYGIKLHSAKDVEGAHASLTAFHGGIKVYHLMHCVSTFSWAKVRKLSFKRKKLLIKLHPDASQFYKETIEFFFDTRNECKTFWKKCVEQHAFFRCASSEMPKKEAKLFSSGSSFRYRGRTHKELIDYVREHHKRREPFTRPLRSATTHQSNYCSSYVSGYVSDPGGTARSIPPFNDQSGTLDARISRKHRSNRTVSVNGPPSDRTTSDIEGPYGNGRRIKKEENEPIENMSLSLPNVLDDITIVQEEIAPKSASGESFFENRNQSIEYDNISHDSYRLSDHEKTPLNRIEEDDNRMKTFGDIGGGYAVLERKDDKRLKEFPFHTLSTLSTIESIGVSTPLDTPSSSSTPIYTSSGAMLLKPRIIPSTESLSHIPSSSYTTIDFSRHSPSTSSETFKPTTVIPAQSKTTVTLIPSTTVSSIPLTTVSSISSSTVSFTPSTTISIAPTTTVTSRPLAGKVITADQLVITSEGLKERPRVKPVPPPKPRLDGSSSTPIVDADGVVIGKCRPALISVKSEDTPDVEKYHLFNSSIPYTLTLRNVSNDSYSTSSLPREGRVGETIGRRKSVDMVPRKRLPSPSSYSSQDHSISATTPDQGDLFEYVLRRRSMSQERSALKNKRNDTRRQTQPVRFNVPPSPSNHNHSSIGSAPFLFHDDNEDIVSESRSLHDGMDRLDNLSSISSEVDKNIDDSLSPDDLPPPPTVSSTVSSTLPTVSKKTPPPPPPKPSNHVISIRTMLMEREITMKRGDERRSVEIKAVPSPTVPIHAVSPSTVPVHTVSPSIVPTPTVTPSTSSEKKEDKEVTVAVTVVPKDSPPYIDDSPKSSKGEINRSSCEESDYARIQRRKVIVQGVNSTFVTCRLSQSLPGPNSLIRSISSDSGEGTICRSYAPSETSLHKRESSENNEYQPKRRNEIDDEFPPYIKPPLIKSESFQSTSTNDKTLNIIREFLSNERTSVRDLNILSHSYESLNGQSGCRVIDEAITLFNQLSTLSNQYLPELEEAIDPWQGVIGISHLLLRISHNLISLYDRLLDQLPVFLSALDQCSLSNQSFSSLISKVISSDECYITMNWLIIRSSSRLIYWPPVIATIIESLLGQGIDDETSISAARICLDKVSSFIEKTSKTRLSLYSFVILLQIESDLNLSATLTHPHRKLIRVGRVERGTRRGLVSRLFLLFNDCILIANRYHGDHSNSLFKVNLHLPLKGLLFEEGDSYKITGRSSDCITLYHQDTCVAFATSSREEWLNDIGESVKAAVKNRAELPPIHIDLKNGEEKGEEEKKEPCRSTKSPVENDNPSTPRKMSAIEISWHRSCSIGYDDWIKMTTTFKSGYMLRKLRNSSGWQKLWIVLANFSLFFFKSHEEKIPLANLPLLEYSVCIPTLQDEMPYEHVFKLVFSTHTYFFRADNQYSMIRWIESIRQSTLNRRPVDAITALALHL